VTAPCYSVALRSVRDNPFLRRTLASLAGQTLIPDEVVIVIPRDVDPWCLDWDAVRFVQAERGMVTQRSAGILSARNRLTLLLDDDVVLAPDAAKLLIRALEGQQAHCVVPFWPEAWGENRAARLLNAWSGIAVPRSAGGIEYLAGGGFYYPTSEPPAEGWRTCGGSGAVIGIDRDFAVAAKATGDPALQVISSYAMHEDGALILTWHQRGGKCLMIPGVKFEHLGGTTRLAPDRLYMSYQAQVYNHWYFWRSYLKPDASAGAVGALRALLSLGRYYLGIACYALLFSLRKGSWQPILGFTSGFRFCLKRERA
jgi:glycosyltransferase involved in cell wall biosynthesis